MTYDEITSLINSTVRTKTALKSISPTNEADCLQAVLDFTNDNIGTEETDDTNFANTNLTASSDRQHNFNSHQLNIFNLSRLYLQGSSEDETIPYIAGSEDGTTPPFYYRDVYSDGTTDGLAINDPGNQDSILVTLNVDGVNQSVQFDWLDVNSGFAFYTSNLIAGTSVTCINYTISNKTLAEINLDAQQVDPESFDINTKPFAFFDGDTIRKVLISSFLGGGSTPNLNQVTQQGNDAITNITLNDPTTVSGEPNLGFLVGNQAVGGADTGKLFATGLFVQGGNLGSNAGIRRDRIFFNPFNSHEHYIKVDNVTNSGNSWTWQLPNKNGTFAMLDDIPSSSAPGLNDVLNVDQFGVDKFIVLQNSSDGARVQLSCYDNIFHEPYIMMQNSSGKNAYLRASNVTDPGGTLLQFPTHGGTIAVVRSVDNFANDSAAATGGVPIGELYHTSGTVKIRLI